MTRQEIERLLLFETDPNKIAQLLKRLAELPAVQEQTNSVAGYSNLSSNSSTTQLPFGLLMNFNTNSTDLSTGIYKPNFTDPIKNALLFNLQILNGSRLRKFNEQLDTNLQKWITRPQVNANGEFIGDVETGNSLIGGDINTETGGGGGGENTNVNNSSFNTQQAVNMGTTLLNGVVKGFTGPVSNSTGVDTFLSTTKSMGGYIGAFGNFLDAANSVGASKVKKFKINEGIASRQRASYGLLYNTMDKALQHSGETIGGLDTLFGKTGSLNKLNKEANLFQLKLSNIDTKGQDSFALANDPNTYIRRNAHIYGDIEPFALSAKQGGVLELDEFIYQESPIIDSSEWIYQEYGIDKFLNGGSFNIIPEGALHARKHNIDLEGITKKGIPVISEGEDGEIQLQAEIEHSEIIFRLEVTLKIEELSKDSSDKAAIEAGKLLAKEILYNTDDKTNLLNLV